MMEHSNKCATICINMCSEQAEVKLSNTVTVDLLYCSQEIGADNGSGDASLKLQGMSNLITFTNEQFTLPKQHDKDSPLGKLVLSYFPMPYKGMCHKNICVYLTIMQSCCNVSTKNHIHMQCTTLLETQYQHL